MTIAGIENEPKILVSLNENSIQHNISAYQASVSLNMGVELIFFIPFKNSIRHPGNRTPTLLSCERQVISTPKEAKPAAQL